MGLGVVSNSSTLVLTLLWVWGWKSWVSIWSYLFFILAKLNHTVYSVHTSTAVCTPLYTKYYVVLASVLKQSSEPPLRIYSTGVQRLYSAYSNTEWNEVPDSAARILVFVFTWRGGKQTVNSNKTHKKQWLFFTTSQLWHEMFVIVPKPGLKQGIIYQNID